MRPLGLRADPRRDSRGPAPPRSRSRFGRRYAAGPCGSPDRRGRMRVGRALHSQPLRPFPSGRTLTFRRSSPLCVNTRAPAGRGDRHARAGRFHVRRRLTPLRPERGPDAETGSPPATVIAGARAAGLPPLRLPDTAKAVVVVPVARIVLVAVLHAQVPGIVVPRAAPKDPFVRPRSGETYTPRRPALASATCRRAPRGQPTPSRAGPRQRPAARRTQRPAACAAAGAGSAPRCPGATGRDRGKAGSPGTTRPRAS